MNLREWVILSGKGGTGKTSVTAALAHLWSQGPGVVIADADVDAADLHLLLAPQMTRTTDFFSGHVAHIDPVYCRKCGLCERLCRFGAIHRGVDGVFYVDTSACEGCKVCVTACPREAIAWEARLCGEWMESTTEMGMLVHARLHPGGENSGRLVSLVRERARALAQQQGIETVLVDGPPGIGCPAIAAITGAFGMLAVTEPTPSGFHDLQRLLQLAKHFRVPAGIVINKADLSESYCGRIESLGVEYSAPVLGRIPYSALFDQAQITGLPITQSFPASEEAAQLRKIATLLQTTHTQTPS